MLLATESMDTMIPGYAVTEIVYEGSSTIIYRGIQTSDDRPVVIKTLKLEHPTFQDITRLKHEVEIIKHLNLGGMVPFIRFETYHHRPALIFEDCGGMALGRFMKKMPFDLTIILHIMQQLAIILGQVHEKNVIHKDINPDNIIICPETKIVKVIDFGIASLLPRESQFIGKIGILEGTLPYISPEQTGRMNRSVDYRTDFYSLGVTFYQLLTGELPFQATDPMELVHCHIAKPPLPPHEINANVPLVISAIVMKLLAKTAEDRYQSAYGLKADLEECFTQWQTQGVINEAFVIGRRDRPSQFQISQRLYGREAEIEQLLNAFGRASLGQSEMILIRGTSGVGKSFLVNEVHKPIVQKRGYFITGKFDQFKRDIPYISLIQAFQELIRQVLTEPEEQVQAWRQQLLQAVGANGQIIIDVIPEVELIIGAQPAVMKLGAAESQNRFNLVFQQFIQVFTKKEHPLVLFLDDLQWADSASLNLLQRLMTEANSQHMLLIGAYRENEVSESHPLMVVIHEIQASAAPIEEIVLKPLTPGWMNQLVAETLACDLVESQPLAELIFHRTQGNPFFANQLLEFLYQEKLLIFEFQSGRWQWDFVQIQSLGITDNIVDLMTGKIQKLFAGTQMVLKLAACIGNKFDLRTVAIVSDLPQATVAKYLWDALQEGLILPVSTVYQLSIDSELDEQVLNNHDMEITYRFLHDRVQQAAYSLIPLAERHSLHLKVGRLILQQMQTDPQSDTLFNVVNQLNLGQPLIDQHDDQRELAQLNLKAGKKAKASAAYEPALHYLSTGIQLLSEQSWQTDYALSFALYTEQAECAYLCGNFCDAEQAFEQVLQNVRSATELAEVLVTKMAIYINQNRYQDAIILSRDGLRQLGVDIPDTIQETAIERAIQQVSTDLGDRSIESLVHLPVMSDAQMQWALRLLQYLAAAAIRGDRGLYNFAILKMVQITLEKGNWENSAYAYVAYGTILGVGRGDYAAGHQFGKVGLQVSAQFKSFQGISHFSFGGFLGHWRESLRQSKRYLADAYQYCYEGGDFLYAVYSLALLVDASIISGNNLDETYHESQQYKDFAMHRHYQTMVNDALVKQQFILNLKGLTQHSLSFSGEIFSEAELVAQLNQLNEAKNPLSRYYIFKSLSLYLFEAFDDALAIAQTSDKIVDCHFGVIIYSEHFFYYSLILAAVIPQAPAAQKRIYWSILEANRLRFQQWATQCPENFQHKLDLISAEVARLEGNGLLASELYDRAITAAQDQGFSQVEAIACELAARYYLGIGRTRVAKAYLNDARLSYAQWGAMAKVAQLDEKYGALLMQTKREVVLSQPSATIQSGTLTTHGHTIKALDWMTVIKASQTLSSEIVFSSLMEKLMQILIENAGAQRGILVTKQEDEFIIEVQGTVEHDGIIIPQYLPIDLVENLPLTLLQYVDRTGETIVLNNAAEDGMFVSDRHIATHQIKSVLCFPITYQGKLTSLLYLENNLTTAAFTPDRLEVLRLLTSQVSISIENASLYSNLKGYSQELETKNSALERSRQQLKDQAQELEQALYNLQHTQAQLVQTEKMSSLGQLVAGVAHEINNPVNFVSGNISCARDYINDLVALVRLYQDQYPTPTDMIQDELETIDFEFLADDLPKLLKSMAMGTERIHNIVLSLRNFSRVDDATMQFVNLHEGLESTLLILQLRLKASRERPTIEVVKDYGQLPLVECYGGQLNQVFMNLIANAIDALDEHSQGRSFEENQADPSTITICTEAQEDSVMLRIIDNGPGMTTEVRERLFDTFFTTKPAGKGTGLGLSISYQIVVEKHHGKLYCFSEPGKGAEFVIELPIIQSSASTAS